MKRHFHIILLCFAIIDLTNGLSSTIIPSAEIPTTPTISEFTESTNSSEDTSEDDFFKLAQEAFDKQRLEDEKTVNETLEKYGPLHDFNMLGLPGPEIAVDEDRFNYSNVFEPPQNGTFKLRLRTVTDKLSYNGRYEEGTITKDKEKGIEIPVVKGQFGEHFQRESGGFYLRTIGYIVDQNGYRQFLLDLTKAEFISIAIETGGPGAPGEKDGISSTVLGTLIGGNLG